MANWDRLRAEFWPAADEFDRQHGTRTAGITSLRRLRIPSPNKGAGTRQQSIDPEAFRFGVRLIPAHESLTFVDIGCGRGRALILAREGGFAGSVIGVEFAPSLARSARRNLQRSGVTATVIDADAATYVFRDEPTVVFLYNPFGAGVLAQVLSNLKRVASTVYLLYINPVHAHLLTDFERVADHGNVLLFRRDGRPTNADDPGSRIQNH